jgi:hypothetical protein
MVMLSTAALPERFRDVDHLEEVMTAPSQALVDDLGRLEGDILILGVAGRALLGSRSARRRTSGSSASPGSPTRRSARGWTPPESRRSAAISSTGRRSRLCRAFRTSCSWRAASPALRATPS